MTEFYVQIPMAGYVAFYINAENEKEAIERAMSHPAITGGDEDRRCWMAHYPKENSLVEFEITGAAEVTIPDDAPDL